MRVMRSVAIGCGLTLAAACGSTPSPIEPPIREPKPSAPATAPSTASPIPVTRDPDVVIGEHAVTIRGRDVVALATGPKERKLPDAAKRSGPHDLYVVPIADAWAALPASDRVRALVEVHPTTPYRMLQEVLHTLGQNESRSFVLSSGAHGPVEIRLRRLARLVDEGAKRLNLVAYVADGGISLKTSAGGIAPGCENTGAGLVAPRAADGSHDLATLEACVRKLKAIDPEFASEETAGIVASPSTPASELLVVALRLRPIFPQLELGFSR